LCVAHTLHLDDSLHRCSCCLGVFCGVCVCVFLVIFIIILCFVCFVA